MINSYQVDLPARQQIVLPASSYAHIRQTVRVRAGQLVIVEGDERQQLDPGDCPGFGSPKDVTFVNETDAPCVHVVALARS